MTSTVHRLEDVMGVSATHPSAGPAPAAPPRADSRGPWRRCETAIAAVVAGIGVLGVYVSWARAADEVAWREQLRWISIAASFAVLVVVAVVGWIVIGMRRLRQTCHQVADQQRQIGGAQEAATELTVAEVLAGSSELWTVPPMTRAHRPGCLLLRGKVPVAVPTSRVDLYPRCGVCRS
ncbi:MAG: hypothetical protein ACT4PP_05025 [Sporichthyaceae bacterium]